MCDSILCYDKPMAPKLTPTPLYSHVQGGGVALMRHALIRFCQHLQVNVHWYVTTPSPDVFSITKRKFHNVLQGVAPRTYWVAAC